ncbi:HAMP domain-containing histidine kinase [Nocardioides albidus]|uniref:Sensor-like histidine kinase SenX3 n=1 Tax=Nocardioides albidus TaxID=1517589 RepID=A0A5C4VQT8_9ACTN|nr:HAMP domain-containing sensor histidine kinase [Nocardioides albidus]TNM38303.1 HAMP domain-containing histidine kinase [Nocardioides albidus]
MTDPTLAATLELIAEGVVEFAGYEIAVVSLVDDRIIRPFVVLGSDDARRILEEVRLPLALFERQLELAEAWGALSFMPAERLRSTSHRYRWVPDLVALDVPDAWRPEDMLCGLLRDQDGRLLGVLSVDLPVSGRRPDESQRATLQMYVRLAERALSTALERGDLEVRVQREREVAEYRRLIVDVLAQELRSTAASIAGTVDLLRARPGLDEQVQAALAVIDGGTGRIRSVVDDMAALARLGHAEGMLRRMTTDLGKVARDTIALQGAGARAREVSVELETVGDVTVVGDPDELDRMVRNLVSNAIKYSEHGGHVTVRVEERAALVVLTVADEGLGIDAADRVRIFDEFFRSRRADVRRRSGAGLGLAIVDRVVALHAGTVRVDSELGAGSTFTVELPRTGPTPPRD